jgi:hypothetical protein
MNAVPPPTPHQLEAAKLAFTSGVWNKRAGVNKLFRAKFERVHANKREDDQDDSSTETGSDAGQAELVKISDARIRPPTADELAGFIQYYQCVVASTKSGFAHTHFEKGLFPPSLPQHEDVVNHRPAFLARQIVACLPVLEFGVKHSPIAILGSGQRFKSAAGSVLTGLVDLLIATTDAIARKGRSYYVEHIKSLIATLRATFSYIPPDAIKCAPLELFNNIATTVFAAGITVTSNVYTILGYKCASEYGLPVDYQNAQESEWIRFTNCVVLGHEELAASVPPCVTRYGVEWMREQRRVERVARKQEMPTVIKINNVEYPSETLLSQVPNITEKLDALYPRAPAALETLTVSDLYELFLIAVQCAADPAALTDTVTTLLDCRVLFETATTRALHANKKRNEQAGPAESPSLSKLDDDLC